jgi:hypothetical protein
MTTEQQKQFARDILTALGLSYSPKRVNFLYAWFKSEGTKAKYNPLATTWSMKSKGSTFFNCLKRTTDGTCKIGVQNYPSYVVGLEATVKTLKQDFYTPIREYLKKDTSIIYTKDADLKKAFDTWGTKYTNFLSNYGGSYKATVKNASPDFPGWVVPVGIGLAVAALSKRQRNKRKRAVR